MQKLTELEATAPKVTKKKMLKEDSATPPMNVSDKPASLKDVFAALSENVIPGQKPLPVLDPQKKQAGMGFVTSDNPAVQNMLKNLDPKDVQIVQAPGQPGQPQVGQQQQQQTGQPAQAGATGQPQMGQMQMKEKDEGKPGKNFAKIAKSAGKRYGSKEAGERVAGAVRAKLAKQGKLEENQSVGRHWFAILDPALVAKIADLPGAEVDPDAGSVETTDPKLAQQLANYAAKNPTKLQRKQSSYINKSRAEFQGGSPVSNDLVGKHLGEGAKVDRMVKHIEKSEKKSGKSKEEAQDIAWATANKRGMLDNKNKKKVKEGDIAPTNGIDTRGAGLGAGRSATTLEGKKPDFLDLDKDGNKKEPMKKAVADKKKKKVDESMNHRISAARLEGKSHGLRGHAHSGKRYEDLDEIRAYHEGYKEGLDECYGQGVYETAPAASVPGMASQAMPTMEDDMEEGNAFTAALAKTPKGGKFSVGGKTFTDRTGYDAKVNEYAFESLDTQLNALLNESEDLSEGLSVSISKGQQNSPDSVTITAQDQEAEHLLAFVKNAGLGLFGDDNVDAHSSAMSVQPAHGAADEVGAGGVEIGVVDGHDGMMGLMQKLSGIQSGGDEDYADEEGDEEQLYGNHEAADKKDCGCDGDCECSDYDQPSNEETCNECGGMMEAGHSCGSKEMVDEVESEDQMEFEVAEDNAPDSDEAETSADEDAEAKEDSALAGAMSKDEEEVNESFASLIERLTKLAEGSGDKPKHPEHDEKDDKDFDDAEEEEKVNEAKEETEEEDEKAEKAGKKVTKDIEYDDKKDKKEKIDEWANEAGKKGTDAAFEADIDFMTKVISGGLNKQKSTGQTTIPVIAGQTERMSAPKEAVNESVSDWVKLAGIK